MRKLHTSLRRRFLIVLTLLLISGGLALSTTFASRALTLASVKSLFASDQNRAENTKQNPKDLSVTVGGRKVTVKVVDAATHAKAINKPKTMDEEIKKFTNRSMDGLKTIKLANGAEMMELEDRFQFVPLAKKNADGTASVFCADSEEAARQFLHPEGSTPTDSLKSQPAVSGHTVSPINPVSSKSSKAVNQTTITIVNINAANVGFNDPTAVAPVGGNPGTTLGQQRLNAFQFAAAIWAATLDSNVEIVIRAQFSALTCTATTATLGSAGTVSILRNFPANGSFPGAEFPDTWYHQALANKRFGDDLIPGAPNTGADDLQANFNVNLGQNANCLPGSPFYLGFDNNHGTGIDLVAVLLHEFAHGLGFSQFASVTSGAQQSGFTDIYARNILDLTTGKTWPQMTNAERVASAINTHKVVWNGARVTADVPTALSPGTPLLNVTTPPAIAGNYDVGLAAFGGALTSPGITAALVQGLDAADAAGPTTTDGCSALTNAAAVAGKIALLDRGTCGFIVKAKNAQDAGAAAVIIVNNAAGSPPPGLGGADPTITIPSVSVTLADGNLIKAQLANGVTATLGLNLSVIAGASPGGKALLYTPNPVQSGSTISHWDTSEFPNQLMEPAINSDLTHSVKLPQDLTLSLMRDIGWFVDTNLNGIADASASTTTLASSANPSIVGQPVTFTATVTAVAPIVGTPTGTVQFKVDGTNLGAPVALVNGQASITTSALTQGIRTITAVYNGSVDFTTSTGTLTQTVDRLAVSLADPAVCTGPGGVVAVTASVTNSGNVPVTINFAASLPPQLLAVPGTCTASIGNCQVVSASSVTLTATLNAGQTTTINYLTQIADGTPTGTQVCVNSSVTFVGGGAPGTVQACTTVNCPTAGPGLALSAISPMSDQKAGSVLIYNVYTSATDPTRQNTRISLTNTNVTRPVSVHLFFVDGTSCSIADSFLCLTQNQTTSFLASDLDPGTSGYLVAVATGPDGCPINFNYLIGDEYVKFQSGHAANLGAEAISALAGGLPFCNANSPTAQLNFDGISYNPVPRVLALDSIPSRADGNDTLLILNRIGGNLGTGANTLINLFGILFDDSEIGLSFGFGGASSSPGTCQFRGSLSNTFPRVTPRFEQFIPAGRTGWAKIYSQADIGLSGAMINFNPNANTSAGAFNQGHNLHILTNTNSANYIIPVFPPGC